MTRNKPGPWEKPDSLQYVSAPTPPEPYPWLWLIFWILVCFPVALVMIVFPAFGVFLGRLLLLGVCLIFLLLMLAGLP